MANFNHGKPQANVLGVKLFDGWVPRIAIAFILALAFTPQPALSATKKTPTNQSADKQPAAIEPVTQVYYYDKPLSDDEKAEIKKAYGSNIVFLPYTGKPPKNPQTVKGTIIFSDSLEDPAWVNGAYAPALGVNKTLDFNNRWQEESFLKTIAPDLMPESILAKQILKPLSPSPDQMGEELEKMRQTIVHYFGEDAIIKSLEGYGSEGHLPTTKHNWNELYTNYLKTTVPEIAKLNAADLDPDTRALQIKELPYNEGRALEQLIRQPQDYLLEKMIPIIKEVRIHVLPDPAGGRPHILVGGTIPRYAKYTLNADETKNIEDMFQSEFLNKLPKKYWKFAAGMDVVLYQDDNGKLKIKIIDANLGMESGYFQATDDIFITNEMVKYFSHADTPYLQLFNKFVGADFDDKAKALNDWLKEYGSWIKKTGATGLWDRAEWAYRDQISALSSDEEVALRLEQALKTLWKAGMRDPLLYEELFKNTFARHPGMHFSENDLKMWEKRLKTKDELLPESALTSGSEPAPVLCKDLHK